MVYLDYAATTPLDSEVLNTYITLLKNLFGNPDSIHTVGVEASRLLEQARGHIIDSLHLTKKDIIFTSGASESNNLALKGVVLGQNKKHIITTNIEHASIINTCQQLEKYFGCRVTYLPVNEEGVVTVEQVEKAICDDTAVVSIMAVNNEVGSINPINEIGKMLHEKHRGILFHCDLVQAVGKIPLQLEYVDMGTISAHKIHGLKGSGILFKPASLYLEPVICGGEQEKGMRGGTINAPAQIVFAKTLRKALTAQPKASKHVSTLNQYLRNTLGSIEDVKIHSSINGSPFIFNFASPVPSEIMMNSLQSAGFMVSAKSTCSSQEQSASHVLVALGITPEEADHTIRVSMHEEVTQKDIESFVKQVITTIEKFVK